MHTANAQEPPIAVVMAVYNTEERWLRDSIESILGQTFSDFEFVIVLDAPTDGSIRIVREYAERDPRIRIIENEVNLGISASLNKAIRSSETRFIARMDADDIAMPERLEKQMDYLLANDLELVSAHARRLRADSVRIPESALFFRHDDLPEALMVENVMPHPLWLGYRDVFERIGFYREWISEDPINGYEDYDFLLRCVKHGVRMGLMDEFLLDKRTHKESLGFNNKSTGILVNHYIKLNFDRIEEISREELREYLESESAPSTLAKIRKVTSAGRNVAYHLLNRNYLRALASLIKNGWRYPIAVYKEARIKHRVLKLGS